MALLRRSGDGRELVFFDGEDTFVVPQVGTNVFAWFWPTFDAINPRFAP
jgi:hypothetical protein